MKKKYQTPLMTVYTAFMSSMLMTSTPTPPGEEPLEAPQYMIEP